MNRRTLIGHNEKFDRHVSWYGGFRPQWGCFDTMVASKFLGNTSHGLKDRYEQDIGGPTIHFEDVIARAGQKKNPDFRYVSIEDALAYGAHDSYQTIALAKMYLPRLQPMWPLFERVYMPVQIAFANMERAGLLIDPLHYAALVEKWFAQIAEYDQIVWRLNGGRPFNIGSSDALSHFLFKQIGFPVLSRTDTGKPSTDEATILALIQDTKDGDYKDKEYRLAVLDAIHERAKVQKMISTYDMRRYVTQPHPGFSNIHEVHGSLRAPGAQSGRAASDGPNTQNIPARTAMGLEVRDGFIAEPDEVVMSADQSQIEPRITAWLLWIIFNEMSLLNSYREGKDIYKTIGSLALVMAYSAIQKGERSAAKVLMLAMTYLASAEGLTGNPLLSALNPSTEKLQSWIDSLYKNIPALRPFHLNMIWWALYKGYVESAFGFRRDMSDLRHGAHSKRSDAMRQTVNHAMQSTSANLIFMAICWATDIIEQLGLGDKIIMNNQVHDEIMSRVKIPYLRVAQALFNKVLCEVYDLGAKMKSDIEIGERWGSLEDLRYWIPEGWSEDAWRQHLRETWADYKDDHEMWEMPPQAPETEELIEYIESLNSPYSDMPLSDITKVFDLSLVKDDKELVTYLSFAAELRVPVTSDRLPQPDEDVLEYLRIIQTISEIETDPLRVETVNSLRDALEDYTNVHPQGIVVGSRQFMTKTDPPRPFHRAQLVYSGGMLDLISFDVPIENGPAQLQGQMQVYRGRPGMMVKGIGPLRLTDTYRDALRDGQPIRVKGKLIRFDALKQRMIEEVGRYVA